jgi:hypothetical protein
VVSDRCWGETCPATPRRVYSARYLAPKWHPSATKRDTSGLFRPLHKPANVQWLASPKGSSGVGRLHCGRRLLNWGQSGSAKPRADPGGRVARTSVPGTLAKRVWDVSLLKGVAASYALKRNGLKLPPSVIYFTLPETFRR